MLMLVLVLQAVDPHPPHNRIKIQEFYYGNTFKKWAGDWGSHQAYVKEYWVEES